MATHLEAVTTTEAHTWLEKEGGRNVYIVIVIFCIILLELQVSRKKLAYDAVPYEGILIRIMHSKSGRGKT